MAIYRLYADDPPSSGRGPDRSQDAQEEARARIGQTLASKYRLDEVVGSGGMGHVYRATNTAIGRTVAIKLLRPEFAQNPEIVERFLREARTANRVNHPNVVDVTDIGQDSDGTPFIVEEFLEGETLLDFAMRQGGKISIADLADIIGPVLGAVAEAHAEGIVHRDLKPENVFLADRRGRRIPKVLDFGISKAREAGSEATKVGVMMGTPAYMPPELVVSFRDADTRCDVWSLGVIIFEMLTGRLPFDGATLGEVFHAVANKDAERLTQYVAAPEALADVVAKCLKRDPAQRYPDAKALAIDLARAIEQWDPEAAKQWSLRPRAPTSSDNQEAAKPVAPPESSQPKPERASGERAAARGATVPLAAHDLKSDKALLAKLEAANALGVESLAATLPSEPASDPSEPPRSKPRDTPVKVKVNVEEVVTPRASSDSRRSLTTKTRPKKAESLLSTDLLMFVAAALLAAVVIWFAIAYVR